MLSRPPSRWIGISASLLLTGCMGNMEVKPMTTDPAGYSAQNFSRAALPRAAQALLPAAGSEPLPFQQLIAQGEISASRLPGLTLQYEQILINDQNDGMLRGIAKSEGNGLLVAQSFNATYHGLIGLASQDADPALTMTNPAYYLHGAKAWQSLKTVEEGQVYVFETRNATRDPLDYGAGWRRSCTAGSAVAASTVAPQLTGQSIPLVCVDQNSNNVTGREVGYAWLSDYGVALQTRVTRANGITQTRYTRVQVR